MIGAMYRDDNGLPCPSCPGALESSRQSLRCTRCSGTWLSHAELDEIMSPPPEFELVEPAEHRRRCPVCREWLQTVCSRGVVLDRCISHGLWFDFQEYRAFRNGVG